MGGTQAFDTPIVLDASFAWWIDKEAKRTDLCAGDVIRALYVELGNRGRDGYEAGKRTLKIAELVIGKSCRPYTHAAAVQRARLKNLCPNSAIGVMGGFRVGSANIRHVALKTRSEEMEASDGRKAIQR